MLTKVAHIALWLTIGAVLGAVVGNFAFPKKRRPEQSADRARSSVAPPPVTDDKDVPDDLFARIPSSPIASLAAVRGMMAEVPNSARPMRIRFRLQRMLEGLAANADHAREILDLVSDDREMRNFVIGKVFESWAASDPEAAFAGLLALPTNLRNQAM